MTELSQKFPLTSFDTIHQLFKETERQPANWTTTSFEGLAPEAFVQPTKLPRVRSAEHSGNHSHQMSWNSLETVMKQSYVICHMSYVIVYHNHNHDMFPLIYTYIHIYTYNCFAALSCCRCLSRYLRVGDGCGSWMPRARACDSLLSRQNAAQAADVVPIPLLRAADVVPISCCFFHYEPQWHC